MSFRTPGLHHVTATTDGDQEDLDFFAGTLGLSLIKQTVNFDDHDVYHFYYADAAGTPGSVMTTFPYGRRDVRQGQDGVGITSLVAFSAPVGSQTFWEQRFAERGVATESAEVMGRPALRISDPSGLPLAVAFGEDDRAGAPGLDAEVALRGVLGVQLRVRQAAPVAAFLADSFGMEVTQTETGHLAQAEGGGPGQMVELVEDASAPEAKNGLGTVHHVAFRARTDAERDALHDRLAAEGVKVTETRDRSYFRSIYFRDRERTGGVLFEVATDGPGFDLDEPAGALGRELRLPPGVDDEQAVREGLPDVAVPTP
ncbi:VOC family protein [Rubrivirga sp. S365]|uniref:VOC family protein n=1 Tax=Rubrivirga litoralis TaxID=3075598 RepID=A0ABU3BTN4_9BACT|nr:MULTISPECIES: VOC family protein [unclassified Rubrivirga]MDT0632655.1 VOC family protein [Rubrivirga sp. F394]MDT7857168.1 VOC family protein [Rubrivirga sp. S365]